MTETKELGKIEPVPLREVWRKEDRNFTPWLAEDENLKLLADTLGLELVREAVEQAVGPFKADIVCRDNLSGTRVLIENQLERSDHTHLGQILTYAAGLDSTVIVWIASNFTEEHRAALDWLNEKSDETVQFFGLEIQLWQIGKSLRAPKFNIVSRPNDWTRSIKHSVANTPLQKLQLEYWAALNQAIDKLGGPIQGNQKPPAYSWMTYPVGKANFNLTATINSQSSWVRAELQIRKEDDKFSYRQLAKQKETIEKELGYTLDWEETVPNGRVSRISCLLKEADINDEKDWGNQHKWLAEKLNEFHKAFAHRIQKL